MAKRKEKTPEELLREYAGKIETEAAHWQDLNENGGSDPFSPDGRNMNLVRNHILWYKEQIREICGEGGFPLPSGYYIPTPPEVDDGYMASMKQKERIERIGRENITRKKAKYDADQLSLV